MPKEYDTKVTTFGELKPGDKIIGADGEPVEVTDVYDKHYPERMYEIEMEDGEIIRASGNHLWYCETEKDLEERDEYFELAKEVLSELEIPNKKDVDIPYPLEDIIKMFGESIKTQTFLIKACKSLGYSGYTPHYIIEDFRGTIDQYDYKYEIKNYSYNNLIDFLLKLKEAVLHDKGYFYFGEVRTTDEIAEIMSKGMDVNIPHKKDIMSK